MKKPCTYYFFVCTQKVMGTRLFHPCYTHKDKFIRQSRVSNCSGRYTPLNYWHKKQYLNIQHVQHEIKQYQASPFRVFILYFFRTKPRSAIAQNTSAQYSLKSFIILMVAPRTGIARTMLRA